MFVCLFASLWLLLILSLSMISSWDCRRTSKKKTRTKKKQIEENKEPSKQKNEESKFQSTAATYLELFIEGSVKKTLPDVLANISTFFGHIKLAAVLNVFET